MTAQDDQPRSAHAPMDASAPHPKGPTLHHVPILPLNTANASLAQVGGKGMNLARLALADFPVPDGFLVTTHAYRAFVAQNHLDDHIRSVLAEVIFDDPASLQAASEAIRARFALGEMATDLRRALMVSYRLLDDGPVAVRSSATAEDLPDMSFAGQQDTFLHVLGQEALTQAVIDCWSSLWTARAMGYRQRNGIDHMEVALSVIVQQMVESQASGVLFTANPLTGTRTQTVIDATLGLGEALVSGQVEPDQYVVERDGGRDRDRDRDRDGDGGGWRIGVKVLGAKGVVIRGVAGGGTETVVADASGVQALPDAAILDLAEMGQRIQDLFGTPQDIEWAWSHDTLFILQSRPITSLFPIPTPPSGAQPDELIAYFSFGAVQGMLDPMTPLGMDAIKGIFANAASLFGYKNLTPESQQVLNEGGERLWGYFSPMLNNRVGRKIMLTVMPAVEPGAAAAIRSLINEPGRLAEPGPLRPQTVLRLARYFLPVLGRVLGSVAQPDKNRIEAQAVMESMVAHITRQHELARTLADRVDLMENVVRMAFTILLPQGVPRIAGGIGALRLLTVQANKLTAIDPAITGQTALEVTRGLPHNVTTEMDLALWTVAQVVRRDPASAARFDEIDAPALAQDYLAGTLPYAAQAAITAFMDRYGMRGLAEIDFGRPRWREQPAQVLQMVQNYLRIDDPKMAPDVIFGRGEAAAQEAVDRMAAAARRSGPLGFLKARLIRGAAYRVRALSGLRESPKFTIIRMAGLHRLAALEIGAELAQAGLLAQAEDVVFLRVAELRGLSKANLAQEDAGVWLARVAERRQAYERELGRRQVPRMILSDGTAFYEGAADDSWGTGSTGSDGDGEGILRGSPVSAGVVEGVVHVVFDPYTAHLAPGEILVCPGTDPAWTPLFLSAGGLVMEVGGLMTHGSVVAREYGIPAVVGVRDCTTRLQTGQRIRVDGSSGEIRVL